MKTKKCSCCGRILSISEFCKNKRTKDGFQSTCRTCQSKRYKLWYEKTRRTKITEMKLPDFTDDELISQLQSRGYTGEIRRVIKKVF